MSPRKAATDEAQELCEHYQKLLRLQDWKVVCRFVRHFEFNDANKCGDIEITLERKEAIIRVLCREDRFTTGFTSSVEHTIVHELLHLHFESVWLNSKKVEFEQAINLIAEALTLNA